MSELKLYEYAPTRSARPRWLLDQLEIPYESVNGFELEDKTELKAIHPQGKLPALVSGKNRLFESVAITNFIADKYAYGSLIPKAGTWERAQHDQWSIFALTELEAYLWHNVFHTFKLPENDRVPSVIHSNNVEIDKALRVVEAHLEENEYFLGDRFQVTDINVGYTINWAGNAGILTDFPATSKYRERLLALPKCPFQKK